MKDENEKKDLWIFLTVDGSASDLEMQRIENVQVLGYGRGDTAGDAFEDFKASAEYLSKYYFDVTYCYKVEEGTKEYFPLYDLCQQK
jgi:hypothetical protein